MNKLVKPMTLNSVLTKMLTGLFISAFSLNVWAENALQNYVNQLQTFSADFEQIQPDEARFQLNESSGIFKLQRPGQLVWQYLMPEEQKIVVDGVNLWVLDEDLEQASVRGVADVKSEIPLSWLLYSERIEDRFDILLAGERRGMTWYNLAPKEPTYFQSIEIGMMDGTMHEVWMYQSSDNITKVRFKNIRQNQPLSPSEFQVKVPDYYDVVGQPQ